MPDINQSAGTHPLGACAKLGERCRLPEVHAVNEGLCPISLRCKPSVVSCAEYEDSCIERQLWSHTLFSTLTSAALLHLGRDTFSIRNPT